MNAPENPLPLADLLALKADAHGDEPLHRQLTLVIREAILSGALAAGSRLPSSRDLARQLTLSRNTVLTAYEQLQAEGYLTAGQGSGTYVGALKLAERPARAAKAKAPRLARRLAGLSLGAASQRAALGGLPLFPGLADPALFPHRTWNRILTRRSQELDALLPEIDTGKGYEPLCRAIARHVAMSRGIVAEPDQVFITAGAVQSLALVTRVLTDPGDSAWVEEPGYPEAHQALAFADLALHARPVDGEGLRPPAEGETAPDPRLIYVTTSYQYPLGPTMPVARRLDLLAAARAREAWIVEDDYDGEFRYRGRPIPALFGLEGNARTIFLGTFSKSLSPGLRMSFVIVPPQLVETFRAVYPSLGNLSSMAQQGALAEFIARGHFARHVELLRKTYGNRRVALEGALQAHCGVVMRPGGALPGGLHIAVGLSGKISDRALAPDLAEAGVGCLPLSPHYRTAKARRNGFLLGFTSADETEIDAAVARLQAVVASKGGRLEAL